MLLFKMKYKKWQTPEMMSAIFIKAPPIIFHDCAGPPMRQDARSHHLTVTLQ